MKHVLIATLGDSPVVVSSMFDLLTKKQQLPVDEVIIFLSSGEKREGGYTMIDDALKGQCAVEPYVLPFEDAYTEEDCFTFLQELFKCLKEHLNDTVYLSLAGGRKNISALMALAAPFYRNVQGLYHVIDKNESTGKAKFRSLQELTRLYSQDKSRFMVAMHPDIDSLFLVPIPLENALHVPYEYLQKLHNMTAEQLEWLWEHDPDEAEKVQFTLKFVESHVGKVLKIKLTEQAKKEYLDLTRHNVNLARDFDDCLRSMQFADALRDTTNKHALTDKKKRSLPSYVYRKGHTTERPFFHTEPGDIMNYPQNAVDTVVVERFAKHRTQTEYIPSVAELLSTPYEPGKTKLCDWEKIIQEENDRQHKPIPSVLIVPLGTRPMVATQLYTLLKNRKRRDIHKVILLYPPLSGTVHESMEIAKSAFKYEHIDCEEEPVPGLEDVTSRADCELYQATLEKVIQRLQETFLVKEPVGVIDLALSGGRKGMAALALFAAQRTRLQAVYHTLIASEELDRKIAFDMEETRFARLPQSEQNDKLFLRYYKAHEADFRLFTVPIGPLRGR